MSKPVEFINLASVIMVFINIPIHITLRFQSQCGSIFSMQFNTNIQEITIYYIYNLLIYNNLSILNAQHLIMLNHSLCWMHTTLPMAPRSSCCSFCCCCVVEQRWVSRRYDDMRAHNNAIIAKWLKWDFLPIRPWAADPKCHECAWHAQWAYAPRCARNLTGCRRRRKGAQHARRARSCEQEWGCVVDVDGGGSVAPTSA